MTRRLSLRARLTMFVTATFALALVVGAATAIERIESSLVADTRSSAEQVLADYLDTVYGGVAAVGVVEETVGTQFFYRDAAGEPISEDQYFTLLASSFETELIALEGEGFGATAFPVWDPTAQPPSTTSPYDLFAIDFIGASDFSTGNEVVAFAAGPLPEGAPQATDLGSDVVAVSQTLVLGDGQSVVVGVSSPLQPVTDSLDTFARVVWLAVPIVIAVVGAVTWLAASRALRPVQGISDRARAITADRLGERVPVPVACDEIGELAETVNGMLDRLEASQQRQRRLVSDASHELRSPVAASRAQLEVALAANDVGDWRRTALTVLEEQHQLSNLIDDLLTLSRLDEGEFRGAQRVDVAEVVHAEVGRPRALRPVARVRPGAQASIDGDERLIERLLRNLVDNAVRHASSTVEVTVARTTDAVVVHVDDDGPGVATEHRRVVFERFTRLDEARTRDGGGRGLGLAIVKEVAEAHRGSVVCLEGPLGGARFSVSLPAGEVGGAQCLTPDHLDEAPFVVG